MHVCTHINTFTEASVAERRKADMKFILIAAIALCAKVIDFTTLLLHWGGKDFWDGFVLGIWLHIRVCMNVYRTPNL